MNSLVELVAAIGADAPGDEVLAGFLDLAAGAPHAYDFEAITELTGSFPLVAEQLLRSSFNSSVISEALVRLFDNVQFPDELERVNALVNIVDHIVKATESIEQLIPLELVGIDLAIECHSRLSEWQSYERRFDVDIMHMVLASHAANCARDTQEMWRQVVNALREPYELERSGILEVGATPAFDMALMNCSHKLIQAGAKAVSDHERVATAQDLWALTPASEPHSRDMHFTLISALLQASYVDEAEYTQSALLLEDILQSTLLPVEWQFAYASLAARMSALAVSALMQSDLAVDVIQQSYDLADNFDLSALSEVSSADEEADLSLASLSNLLDQSADAQDDEVKAEMLASLRAQFDKPVAQQLLASAKRWNAYVQKFTESNVRYFDSILALSPVEGFIARADGDLSALQAKRDDFQEVLRRGVPRERQDLTHLIYTNLFAMTRQIALMTGTVADVSAMTAAADSLLACAEEEGQPWQLIFALDTVADAELTRAKITDDTAAPTKALASLQRVLELLPEDSAQRPQRIKFIESLR